MLKELDVPNRILMGPGPSDVHPDVLKAMATPLLGHLDPKFLEIMNEIMEQLRRLFGTTNRLTLPMSGTGSAGMETLFVNLMEPGDKVIIGVNGLFSQRMVDMAKRCGAEVLVVDAAWGEIIDYKDIEALLKKHGDVKFVAVVHAETSTGVLQPLEELAKVVHQAGALLLVDAVTSLGGVPVDVDKIGIDACFSGTQKCISAPPGLAPVTFNQRAMDIVTQRKTPIHSWYLDVSMIQGYWGQDRSYHHTAPINMNYAIREALRRIENEGIEATYDRHEKLGRALQYGLEQMGLELHVKPEYRLPQLTAVRIPEGVSDTAVRGQLLADYGIEIGGGLGDLKGKIWRVGLMGHSCNQKNVILFLSALENILIQQGQRVESGIGVQAALSKLVS